MYKITDVRISPMEKSQYVIPMSMFYVQNGLKKQWDIVKAHSSVVIIIYNTTRNVLVLVKQFRPAVYYGGIPEEDRQNTIDVNKYPPELGVTIEFCAGILDKNKSMEETAKEEVLEECGYDVPVEKLKKIKSYRSTVGILGDQQTLYFVEVTDDMKKTDGGGIPGEFVEIYEISLEEAQNLLQQEKLNCSGGFLFALSWFLLNQASLLSH